VCGCGLDSVYTGSCERRNEPSGSMKRGEVHDHSSSARLVVIHVTAMKSSRMIWMGHVARMGDEECIQNFNR
jgi:hypothetical protein